jgi:hypothetical protein
MSPRRDLLARNCPNCGAAIEGEPAGDRVACRYCGQTFEVAAPAPSPRVGSPPRVVVLRGRPVSALRRAASAFLVLFFGAVLIGVRFGLLPGRAAHSPLLRLPTLPTGAVPSAFMWDTVGGPPIPVAVGPEPVEGFIGRVRTRGDDNLWIVAFDGVKLGPVWKAGPFGTYSEGYLATHVSVVAREVVVTDYRSSVHVFELASGRPLRTVKLTDRAKSMCAAPDGKARVWIEVADEKNVAVDTDSGTVTAAPRPAWCAEAAASGSDCRGWLRRGPGRPGCKDPGLAPKVSGFEANNVLEDGDLAVALGKKRPGTALPMIVGFDPKTRAVRWQTALAPGDQAGVAESTTISIMDALAGGRFAAPYEVTSKGWHFAAFEARSGQRLWDVALQAVIGVDHPEGFSLSAARLYVMRTSSLEIYDARTGAFLGTVGG